MSELQTQTSQQECAQTLPANTWSEVVQVDEAQRRKEQESRAGWFARLFVPSVVYAILYTVFTYQSDRGIGICAWIAVSALYTLYLMRASDIHIKKGGRFLLAFMGLLGLSTLLTANEWLILCNNCGFRLLLLYFLLTQTRDSDGWSILEMAKYMLFAVFGAVGKLWTPFADGYYWLYLRIRARDGMHSDEQMNRRHMALLGIIITIPVVIFLGNLLMSADAVFSNMMSCFSFSWMPDIDLPGIGLCFLFGLFASYCGMRYLLGSRGERAAAVQKKYPAVIAQIVTSAVLVLYIWFCLVQVIYLFGGFGTLPDGMTYAQYARSGFFQLLFVCILNLFLVLAVRRWSESGNYLKKVLLGICLCSYVMTASSAYRMILYVQAYHLTVLRVVVLTALAVIAILLAGVIANIYDDRFRILPFFTAVITVVYTMFSFSNAEGFVVRYDLEHMTEENADGILDYLSRLSLDSMPEAIRFFEQPDNGYATDVREKLQAVCNMHDIEIGEEMFEYLHPDNETYGWFVQWLGRNRKQLNNDSLMSWNVSAWRAKQALNEFLNPSD